MEAGWGAAFLERFLRCDERTIATIRTKDHREFLARQDEIEVLPTFPAVWVVNRDMVIPEAEIVRVEISGRFEDPE